MPCCLKQKSHKNGVARRGWFGGGSVLTEVLISETVVGNVLVETISFFAHSSFLIFYSKKEFKYFGNWERCGKTSPSGMFVHFFFFFWNCLYCAGGPDSKRNKQRKAFCFATKFYKDVLSHQRNLGCPVPGHFYEKERCSSCHKTKVIFPWCLINK